MDGEVPCNNNTVLIF